MSSNKPTVVFIHGAWHIPQTYTKLISVLRSAGLETHIPRLLSTNESRPPNADLETDTGLIRGYVESLVEAGRRVVVIMHSYGGQVGTNALHGLGVDDCKKRGLPGGVSHLIYLCAFALPEGGSMVGKVKEFGHEHLLPLAFEFAEDDSCTCRDPKSLLIGSSSIDDAEEVDQYLATLVRWNGKSMYQPITKCAWREIPVTYIYTSQDMTVPLEYHGGLHESGRTDCGDIRA